MEEPRDVVCETKHDFPRKVANAVHDQGQQDARRGSQDRTEETDANAR